MRHEILKALIAVALVSPIATEGTVSDPVHAEVTSCVSEDAATPESPRLQALLSEVQSGNEGALAAFWEEISASGAPLVEPIEEQPGHCLVTFLWKDDGATESVQIFGGATTGDAAKDRLIALPGTDIWHRTTAARTDLRTVYYLSINGTRAFSDMRLDQIETDLKELVATWQCDPLNPNIYSFDTSASFQGSILELSDAPPQPFASTHPSIPQGTVEKVRVSSKALGNERDVWVYTPSDFDQAIRYPLLILFDGEAYMHFVPTPTILDNLIGYGEIPPLVAVLIGNVTENSRNHELPCNASFAQFLAEEIVPWMQIKYAATSDPLQTVVGGSSYGGLAAAYAALSHPDIFGNVLSQSGAFWWRPSTEAKPSLICQLYRDAPQLPIRFYMDIGLQEHIHLHGLPNMIEVNEEMKEILLSKGYDVAYAEFNGGHDYICWKGTLSDGLIALFKWIAPEDEEEAISQ